MGITMHNQSLFFTFLALSCLTVNAQTQSTMQDDMMKNMAAMENCMRQIDYQELALMEQKSMQLETEMRAHCNNGEEDKAKDLAVNFSEEVMNSNTMQAMKKCAAMMPGMEDQLNVPDFRQEVEQHSICDIINGNQR